MVTAMARVPSSSWFDLSPTGRGRVVLSSILVTLGCIILSFIISAAGLDPFGQSSLPTRLVVNVVLPIVIAFPTMYFLMSKIRELAVAHRELQIIASTDSLTQVMNRAAFSTLVDAYLTEVRSGQPRPSGALLIIDADNFKSVNDRYGHDRGDEALVTIARSIKSMLRGPELVGRLGGEEFGVFLPSANHDRADTIAERIRRSVNDAPFEPAGAPHRLSVSVGGAVFDAALPFSELFRFADQQLYAAKQRGRNRVAIATVRTDGRLAAA